MEQWKIRPAEAGLKIRMKKPGSISTMTVPGATIYEAAYRLVSAAEDLRQTMKLRQILREQNIDWVYRIAPGDGRRVPSSFGPDIIVPWSWRMAGAGRSFDGVFVARTVFEDGTNSVVLERFCYPNGATVCACAPFMGNLDLAIRRMRTGLQPEEIQWWRQAG